MKQDFDERWQRLAEAAVGARNDLRRLAYRLDDAVTPGHTFGPAAAALIQDAAAICGRHAGRLLAALKSPEVPRTRQNAPSKACVPLWRTGEGNGGGRYRQPERRRQASLDDGSGFQV